MPDYTTKSNTDGAGTCGAQLASSTSCSFSCKAGYASASYSCLNGTLTEPAEACLACELYQHSDGDASSCTNDAAYVSCGCTSAACSESTALGKYFVIGNSNADDSQCLDLTISQASDVRTGSHTVQRHIRRPMRCVRSWFLLYGRRCLPSPQHAMPRRVQPVHLSSGHVYGGHPVQQFDRLRRDTAGRDCPNNQRGRCLCVRSCLWMSFYRRSGRRQMRVQGQPSRSRRCVYGLCVRV